MLTVSTIATTTLLTTRARAETELGETIPALDDYIRVASAAIVSYCHRPFAREVYSETLPGLGGTELQLARTPLVGSPSLVAFDTFPLTDYSIASDLESVLYRRGGWGWTGYRGGFFFDQPIPRTEESVYRVDYTAGYILPPQNLVDVDTLSVDATDNSFNDSAAGFPTLLRAGDIVEALGFSEVSNNGRFVVTGTPTASKVVVDATLVAEVAASGRTLRVQTLPADVEKAAVEATKAYYAQRATDSAVEERQVGQLRVRYGSRGVFDQPPQALPPVCIGLLRPWVRAASL